ncbi:hypothetical protein HMPREF1548_06717 [Clostridium sp. KLE 1755]|nr:hypothetical protein HMPREF1548_06717 [Clostridium sp. KLE 1755]
MCIFLTWEGRDKSGTASFFCDGAWLYFCVKERLTGMSNPPRHAGIVSED